MTRYARLVEGQPQFIYGEFTSGEGDDAVNHPRGWVEAATPEALAAVGVGVVVEAEPAPDGQQIASETLMYENGVFYVDATYADLPDPPRREIPKSTVQARLAAIGKFDAVFAILLAQPVFFGKWFAPDWPNVFFDDADMLMLLAAAGCTEGEIAVITA
jgi:hypothetical protein